MPITLDEWYRDWVDELLNRLPPEKRVRGLTPEQRNQDLSTEELERLIERRRAAEASAKRKASGKPRRKAP